MPSATPTRRNAAGSSLSPAACHTAPRTVVVAESTPASALSRLVFPAPDGPSTPIRRPARAVPLWGCTSVRSPTQSLRSRQCTDASGSELHARRDGSVNEPLDRARVANGTILSQFCELGMGHARDEPEDEPWCGTWRGVGSVGRSKQSKFCSRPGTRGRSSRAFWLSVLAPPPTGARPPPICMLPRSQDETCFITT